MKKNIFMEEALKEAQIAFEKNEVPVGAVIVENGKIIARGHNQNKSLKDAIAHAEIIALQAATKSKNSPRLDDCEIYITLEPCSMCAAAISLARIKKVYYGAADEKFGAISNGNKLFPFHKPELYSNICEAESVDLLRRFFKAKRKLTN